MHREDSQSLFDGQAPFADDNVNDSEHDDGESDDENTPLLPIFSTAHLGSLNLYFISF